MKLLKNKGFFVCCSSPCDRIAEERKLAFYTIWINLQLPLDRLFANLHKQFRYDVRRAKKLGVTVRQTVDTTDLERFYHICKKLSFHKNFNFSAKKELMIALSTKINSDTELCLFVANYQDHFCGGALIMRCGGNVYYIWGATDRDYLHLSIGEALQWAVVEWAHKKNCACYDLGGISAQKNSGVDRFKQRLGGEVVITPGIQVESVGALSNFFSWFMKQYLWIKSKSMGSGVM